MRVVRSIQAVIFDLDDTLIDWSGRSVSWDQYHRSHSDQLYGYLQEQGYQLPPQQTLADLINAFNIEVWREAKSNWHGARFVDALDRAFRQLELENVDLQAALRAYNWEPMPGVDVFPETLPVLQTLQQQEYKMGLITNSFLPMWMRDVELDHYQLLPYLPKRITSGDTKYMKPHPAIFWRMLGMLDCMPEQAVFVGDRLSNDILGGNNVGMVTVWRPNHDNQDKSDTIVPDYTIQNLRQLLPILEELESE